MSAELANCDRGCVTCKAKNTYYLAETVETVGPPCARIIKPGYWEALLTLRKQT